MLAAFGSRRERYTSAQELQTFSGIAPVMQASGRQCWILFRWACPKFLRQTFQEYAARSIRHSAWAKAFYEKQKAKGKGHHAAVRSLAFKWIRILFRCWQSRQTCQEQLYLAARQGLRRAALTTTYGAPSGPLFPPAAACGKAPLSGLKSAREILKSLLAEA